VDRSVHGGRSRPRGAEVICRGFEAVGSGSFDVSADEQELKPQRPRSTCVAQVPPRLGLFLGVGHQSQNIMTLVMRGHYDRFSSINLLYAYSTILQCALIRVKFVNRPRKGSHVPGPCIC
jgi:hypothetical protein